MLIKSVLIILSVGLSLSLGYFWLSNSQQTLTPNSTTLLAEETMSKKLQSALEKCIKDSRMYFEIIGLKEADNVRQLIENTPEKFWEKLSPLENFFAFEIVPETVEKAPSNTVAQAYCSALKQLPGDWWGLPGGSTSESGEHLLKLPNIRDCLVELLTDTTPLDYFDGESRTLAKIHQWQVSDLAAGFILSLSEQEYDADASIQERETIKKQLQQ